MEAARTAEAAGAMEAVGEVGDEHRQQYTRSDHFCYIIILIRFLFEITRFSLYQGQQSVAANRSGKWGNGCICRKF